MSQREPIVAVVPVREGSQRINEKNFRPFGGHETLLHNKIDQLRRSEAFDEIYVSSDSARVKDITIACGARYLPRNPEMCTSKPRWDEVVVSVMNDVPGDPHVAWAMVTSPLYEGYREAMQKYMEVLGEYDSLIGVKKVREYLIDEQCRPLFGGFGIWHPYTTEIRPLYAISDTVFVAQKSKQIVWRYWFGRKPYMFENSPVEAIDVNFEEDLELAYAAEGYLKNKSGSSREVV